MIEAIVQVLSGIAIAAATSWITVRLSTRRFRSERWWEKKVAAYERVVEAFHHSKKFDSEHMLAVERGGEVDPERDKELRQMSRLARDEILKAADVGSFVLSEAALRILARYQAEADNAPREPSWYEHLDASWGLTHRYMKEFVEEARKDLKK